MSGVNKAIVLGRLGQDPEVRYTQGGEPIARFSVATSSHWKDRTTGQAKEETEWHRAVLFGRLADIAQKYLAKGREVYLEGRLKTRKWQGQDGIDRYTTEIVVENLTLICGRANGDSQAQAQTSAHPQGYSQTAPGGQTYARASQPNPTTTATPEPDDYEDLPF